MYAQKYERPIDGVSQAAYQRLFGHTWPGNVRELQNVIERAVLLAKGKQIEPVDLAIRQWLASGRRGRRSWMGRAAQHDAGRYRASGDRKNAATHRRQQAGGGKSARDLSPAALQQDQKVQY